MPIPDTEQVRVLRAAGVRHPGALQEFAQHDLRKVEAAIRHARMTAPRSMGAFIVHLLRDPDGPYADIPEDQPPPLPQEACPICTRSLSECHGIHLPWAIEKERP
jgi:hypothetical protein